MTRTLSSEELKAIHGQGYVKKFESQKKRQKKRLAGIIRQIELSKEDEIVDFGCGSGLLFELIHSKIKSYSGVDFSKEFIQLFKQKLGASNFSIEANLFCEDILKFTKLHPDKYDKAFTLDFSEHLYDDDFNIIYAAVKESLKDDGELILHTPNAMFFLEWMRNNGILKQKEEHIGVRRADEYIDLLTNLGYRSIEIKMIPHYNVLKYLHPLSYMPFIGKFFKARILIICKK